MHAVYGCASSGYREPVCFTNDSSGTSVPKRFRLLSPANRGSLRMAASRAKYIIAAIIGSFGIAYISDKLIADDKIFGGTTPKTVATNEWWQATDEKFQAWPRTAGPPVVMNPISRQNFIVKSRAE